MSRTRVEKISEVIGDIDETDPVFVAWDKDYADLSNKPTIPTALSALTDDATHRLVTDTEKANFLTSVEKAKLPQMIIFTYNL